jgi:hypothetical protein
VLAVDLLGVVVKIDAHGDVLGVEIEVWLAAIDHPGKGEICKRLVRIATTDVAVDPRKPGLLQLNRLYARKNQHERKTNN